MLSGPSSAAKRSRICLLQRPRLGEAAHAAEHGRELPEVAQPIEFAAAYDA